MLLEAAGLHSATVDADVQLKLHNVGFSWDPRISSAVELYLCPRTENPQGS